MALFMAAVILHIYCKICSEAISKSLGALGPLQLDATFESRPTEFIDRGGPCALSSIGLLSSKEAPNRVLEYFVNLLKAKGQIWHISGGLASVLARMCT